MRFQRSENPLVSGGKEAYFSTNITLVHFFLANKDSALFSEELERFKMETRQKFFPAFSPCVLFASHLLHCPVGLGCSTLPVGEEEKVER